MSQESRRLADKKESDCRFLVVPSMSQDQHFKFVKNLALELNRKEIKLSSFPDVVMRVRKALDDEDTTGEKLARILSVDPVLASRILVLANSTFYNPAGIKIEGLDAAIGRIGFEKVRTTAISYAVEQLHSSQGLDALKTELRQTWSAGIRLAALTEVIAQQCTKLDTDSAFIAGLLNQIGVLYIFTKYDEYPDLLQDPEARQNLIDEWAAPIGENIVANWDFSDEIQATLNPDADERARRGTDPDLTDVVIAAKASLNGADDQLFDTPEAKRLRLNDQNMPTVMEQYEQKLMAVASAVRPAA